MRARLLVPLVALVALAAPVGAKHTDRDPLAGRIAGKAESCAPNGFTNGLSVAGPDRVMTSFTARRIWVAPVVGCPALRTDDILIIEHLPGGSGYCENDRIRALRPGGIIPGPYCRLGAFTPYDKPK